MTFDAAVEAYLRTHERDWKSLVHRQQWRASLRDHVSPVIGGLDVNEITTDDILRALNPIWGTIEETASRIRQRIETVLDFVGRNGANPARWAGHLEHKLPKRNRKRAKHYPALPYRQMSAFMATLRAIDTQPARALEFAILTGGRTGEIWVRIGRRSIGKPDVDDPCCAHQARRGVDRAAERCGASAVTRIADSERAVISGSS